MDKEKIIRQAFINLGINRSDLDINNNVYYRNAVEILNDMRNQILEGFEFQTKFQTNLAILPTENFPNIYKDGICLVAHTLPSDFYSLRSVDEYNENLQIKGNVLYMPSFCKTIEYYSDNIEYEDFPKYVEQYVVYCLCSRMSIFLGRDSTQFMNMLELEKVKIRDVERRNTGFSYNGNSLVRY